MSLYVWRESTRYTQVCTEDVCVTWDMTYETRMYVCWRWDTRVCVLKTCGWMTLQVKQAVINLTWDRTDETVLQCVVVCYSVLQCVAVCCSVLQCVAVCCSVLQCHTCDLRQDCWEIHVCATRDTRICVIWDTHTCVTWDMTHETHMYVWYETHTYVWLETWPMWHTCICDMRHTYMCDLRYDFRNLSKRPTKNCCQGDLSKHGSFSNQDFSIWGAYQ